MALLRPSIAPLALPPHGDTLTLPLGYPIALWYRRKLTMKQRATPLLKQNATETNHHPIVVYKRNCTMSPPNLPHLSLHLLNMIATEILLPLHKGEVVHH